METPYNENLLVATSGNAAALVTAFSEEGGAPLGTGHRNQYNIGFQQALSRYAKIEAEYFWKHTLNAFDFGVLFNTPVAFPITWPKIENRRIFISSQFDEHQRISVVHDDGA